MISTVGATCPQDEMDTDQSGDVDFSEFFVWHQKQKISMNVLPECLMTENKAIKVRKLRVVSCRLIIAGRGPIICTRHSVA